MDKVERMCCVCRRKIARNQMIRVAKVNSDFVVESNTSIGRGAYVCKDCIQRLSVTKGLHKSFRCNVPSSVYEEVEEDANERF